MIDKKLYWGKISRFDRYLFEILIAIELLMSFTFLGYIHIPPISVTIAYLPVLIAGCLWEPPQAVMISLVFGIASTYKASASYVMPTDAVFSPFLSGAPVSSLLLSIGTRMLFGFLIGVAFQCVRKGKHSRLYIGLIAAIASVATKRPSPCDTATDWISPGSESMSHGEFALVIRVRTMHETCRPMLL